MSEEFEVEIVAVVPPRETEPVDVWDTRGQPCPICLKDIDNGDKIVVLSCGGNHFLCKGCHHVYEAHDRRMQAGSIEAPGDADESDDDLSLSELVRRTEGADKCPVCRQMSHCAAEVVAQNYYPGSGRTEEEAIMID